MINCNRNPNPDMGSSVSVSNTKQTNLADDRCDWFTHQGYALDFEIKVFHEVSHKICNNGRYDIMLPITSPETAKRNDDIYQYIRRVKEQSEVHPTESRELLRIE